MSDDIRLAAREFVEAFETVFGDDWQYTKEVLGVKEDTPEQEAPAIEMGLEPIYFIAPSGTFLNPLVEDETEDWGNRAALLDRYRRLKNLLSS